MFEVIKLSLDKIFAITTIKKGFKNSIGWKVKKKISNHRFDPFASTPKNNTRNKVVNIIKKIGIKIFFKKLIWNQENKIIKNIEHVAKIKCLEKK